MGNRQMEITTQGESEMLEGCEMESKRRDCEEEFQRIWSRLSKGDDRFEEMRKSESKQDLDIMEIRTQIVHLVSSMAGLTKALWGIVVSICGVGIGFIIWYIQLGGIR